MMAVNLTFYLPFWKESLGIGVEAESITIITKNTNAVISN
jgi:hypothetical protein